MPKRYDEEFRARAVKLVRDGGVSMGRAAKELGIAEVTLSKWLSAAAQGTPSSEELLESERTELKRLRKENAELRMERDILKKATAYFAKTTL